MHLGVQRSAELMPQFVEAVNKLRELGGSHVMMAKLDSKRYQNLLQLLGSKSS